MLLRVFIVEDEPLSQHYLSTMLRRLPTIEIIGKAATEEEAVGLISSIQPDLVFMDIELHSGTGFEVLHKTEHLSYSVVFTTALEQHAIKIIKLSGVPFLQKPIDADELENVVKQVIARMGQESTALRYLLQTLRNNNMPKHIALHDNTDVNYIELSNVLYIAAGESTIFYLQNGSRLPHHRSLKEIEDLLDMFHFFRVTAKHIVNLAKIGSVSPSGDNIILSNGSSIPLSPKKREALIMQLTQL